MADSSIAVSRGRSLLDDPSSIYFIHRLDNPGTSLVSQSLTGDNYASWSHSMKIALSVKNKLGFIDGSVPKPQSPTDPTMVGWTRNNNMVMSWIISSVSKTIGAGLLYSSSAYKAWTDLEERFQNSNGPRIFQLRRDLLNLTQGQDSVGDYYTKLKALWEELNSFRLLCTCSGCTCGGIKKMQDHHQRDYVLTFLMGLSDTFSGVRGQALLMDPLPPITRVFSLVSQEEKQRSVSASMAHSPMTMASATKHDNGSKHFTNGQKRDRPFCIHCKMNGHTVEKCYKLHGYPPGHSRAKSARANAVQINPSVSEPASAAPALTAAQYQQLLTLLSTVFDSKPSTTNLCATGGEELQNDWQQ